MGDEIMHTVFISVQYGKYSTRQMSTVLGERLIHCTCAVFSNIARKMNTVCVGSHDQVSCDLMAIHCSSKYSRSVIWADTDLRLDQSEAYDVSCGWKNTWRPDRSHNVNMSTTAALPRQTAVTACLRSEQLLLFAIALRSVCQYGS